MSVDCEICGYTIEVSEEELPGFVYCPACGHETYSGGNE